MRSTFLSDDVELLLKDISGMVVPLPTEEREKRIQSGIHYCEMLPLEYKPSSMYITIYEKALEVFSKSTAEAVGHVSQKIWNKMGRNVVIISLARAGTPVGVLIKRYIKKKYQMNVPHYSISIIRDRGIDKNAMKYILFKHNPKDIIFVDGWVGKGAILGELKRELNDFPEIQAELAVLADPANLTDLCGTHDDLLIPSSCLNSTVCGLISRTFLRSDIIGENDFHGAVYYEELMNEDRTYEFISTVEKFFNLQDYSEVKNVNSEINGLEEVKMLADKYGIQNINFIKPGIGETTRVLLRRIPWKILISREHAVSNELELVYQLAKEKRVPIEITDLYNYKCCGIIKKISDV